MQNAFSITHFLNAVRTGIEPQNSDIQSFIQNLSVIPIEQVAAFLAHAFHKTLSSKSTTALTLAMRDSGKTMNWQGLDRQVVDKHSTGGVGDKITICLAPVLVALGFAVPTVMGRGLGFTGGTVDKLEAIPGMKLEWSVAEAERFVRTYGMVFSAQSEEIAPADKLLYALRDVTGTVESIPLITASILSKKLSESLNTLIMDVKWGSGAFMPSLEQARALATSILNVAKASGTQSRALITSMQDPIGETSGNWSEVCEAVRVLQNVDLSESEKETRELTLQLAIHALLATQTDMNETQAREKAESALSSGLAFETFAKIVRAQNGRMELFEKTFEPYAPTPHKIIIKADRSGRLRFHNVKNLGLALVLAGAGRQKKSDVIDPQVFLKHPLKTGAAVKAGETILELGLNNAGFHKEIRNLLDSSFEISDAPLTRSPLIQEILV